MARLQPECAEVHHGALGFNTAITSLLADGQDRSLLAEQLKAYVHLKTSFSCIYMHT